MQVNQRDLYASLAELARVAGKGDVLQLESEEEGALVLTASDGANTLTFTLPAEETVASSVSLPAKLLAKICKPTGCRNAPAVVGIGPTKDGVKVIIDGLEHMLVGEPAPLDPAHVQAGDEEWQLVAMWSAKVAREALGFARGAISNDDSRPHLQAVLLSDGSAIGSDGHRAHIAPLPMAREPILLPDRAARTLHRLLAHGDYASLHRDENQLRVQGERWRFQCALSEEQFPDVWQVIPGAQPINLSVDAAMLRRAVAQVTKFAASGLRLTVNGAITVGADTPAGTVEVRVPTQANTHQGDDLVVGIDPKYLAEALPKGAELVQFGFDGALDPMRVDVPDDGRIAVVMPMRLS